MYTLRERRSSKQRGHDEITNIEKDREIMARRIRIVQRKTVLREQERYGEIINIGGDRKTRRGEFLSIRRMQRNEDSRIKIEAEVKIMYKRAALTRSTMQDQDRGTQERRTRGEVRGQGQQPEVIDTGILQSRDTKKEE